MSFWVWVPLLMLLAGGSGFFYGLCVGSDIMLAHVRRRYLIGIPEE
jgi:hypothetical protein